jgi:hypothetical protein
LFIAKSPIEIVIYAVSYKGYAGVYPNSLPCEPPKAKYIRPKMLLELRFFGE